MSCNVTPTSVTPAANGEAITTMTVSVPSWVTPGSYFIGLDCQSSTINKYKNVNLDVFFGQGPSFSVNPSYGEAGDTITLNGRNYTTSVGEVVTIREVTSGQTVGTSPVQIMVSQDGSWTGTATIPTILNPGTYRFEAKVNATGERAPEVDFQLVSSGDAFTVGVSPRASFVQTAADGNSNTVNINIDSLGASVTANVYVEFQGLWWLSYRLGSLANNVPASGNNAVSVPAGGSNSVSLTLTADLTAPSGSYFVGIRVEDANDPNVYKLTDVELIVTPPSGYNASITLSPSTGSARRLQDKGY